MLSACGGNASSNGGGGMNIKDYFQDRIVILFLGSGGRIAVQFSGINTYNGSTNAFGGTGLYPGGPGTVFVQNGTDAGYISPSFL